MSWNLIVAPQAEEDLSKLDKPIKERIKSKLKEILENSNSGIDPEHYIKWINKYEIHRLRIGDYRAFIDLNKEEKEIKVLTILNRDDAYSGWG